MLKQHLRAHTSPIAEKENMLCFGNFRITVLGERLFRIEENAACDFLDDATLCVWFRNMPKQSFSVEYGHGNTCVTVTTPALSLTVSKSFEDSFAVLDGKKIPLTNEGNLLGTARTLDCYDGTIYIRDMSSLTLDNGVCSRTGVAILDDTSTLTLCDSGEPAPAHGSIRDIYVFAFGNDYRGAVRALYGLCGSTPLLPRFSLGNWWSRYHKYTDAEYIHILRRFEDAGIPLSVAMIDVGWHMTDELDSEKKISESGKDTAHYGCAMPQNPAYLGWTGYSWNKKLFPDYKAFLNSLYAKNLRVSLNLHPRDGVRFFEDMYPEMARAMGIDPATEKVVEFDFENTDFINSYFEILHNPYERDGVDFWWIDWQQGTKSKSTDLDPLWALNHFHFLDIAKSRALPMIVSRYAGVGSHRYPVGFSGDTSISWATLALMPYFTANAANIGYTWWGHDIGGHHLGIKDDELYLRFLQFGVFSPMNRMHCTDSPMLTKEPWEYKNGIGELAAEMLRLRHALIPFLYNCNHLTHTEGLALCEPMYYKYPECPEAYEYKNQYMFGQSLLVAPIVRHSEQKSLCGIDVWLPEGRWTDIFTGNTYTSPVGGKAIHMVRPLDSIPVLAHEGTVLPLSRDFGNSTENPHSLELKIFNGNGHYSLYEDTRSADNSPCTDVRSATTEIDVRHSEGCVFLEISVTGDTAAIPADRTLRVSFPNIIAHPLNEAQDTARLSRRDTVSVTVQRNGEDIPVSVDTYGALTVEGITFDAAAVYTVSVKYTQPTDAEVKLHELCQKLLETQCPFYIKQKLFDSLCRCTDKERMYSKIMLCDLDVIDKQNLLQVLL